MKTLSGFYEYYQKHKPSQRLGQAACNYFDWTDPILFYLEDSKKAHTLVMHHVDACGIPWSD